MVARGGWRRSTVQMNSIPWSPVLRYATPLSMNRTPVSTVALQHKSVSSVLQYATPLPINRTPVSTVGGPFPPFCGTPHPSRSTGPPFRPWPVEHKAVSSVLRYARPRFDRLFRPRRLAPDEHEDDAVSPFRPSHVHESWPYVCAGRRSRPCPYVRTWPYFLSCTLAVVRTCTCYVRASTMTRARLYIDQYVRTRSRPE